MTNNAMIEYKENLISRIKNFFRKLFGFHRNEENIIMETPALNVEEKSNIQNKNSFFDEIKVDTDNIDKLLDKKNFLKEIDGNAEALKMLSIERLKKLSEYYSEIIDKNDKLIKKLKANN